MACARGLEGGVRVGAGRVVWGMGLGEKGGLRLRSVTEVFSLNVSARKDRPYDGHRRNWLLDDLALRFTNQSKSEVLLKNKIGCRLVTPTSLAHQGHARRMAEIRRR